MVSLRNLNIGVALLASQAHAFQHLTARATFAPLITLSLKPPPVTRLRALQAKGDQFNATEAIAISTDDTSTSGLTYKYMEQALAQERQLLESFDLSEDIINKEPALAEAVNPFEGLFWRGAVVLLCALWASNFPMAKLIMAEPGVDSSLYSVTRFGIAALALAPFAVISTRRTGMDWETFRGAISIKVLCDLFSSLCLCGNHR
jgi:hypothetical protein